MYISPFLKIVPFTVDSPHMLAFSGYTDDVTNFSDNNLGESPNLSEDELQLF